MKKLLCLLFCLILSNESFAWGPIGHRVVGHIAERYLSKKAKKNIESVLRNETLAEVSTYMDFIKSDATYIHMSPWHYATIPDGRTYEEIGTPEEGDIIDTLERLIGELKSKIFTDEDEAFTLKCLVHLVGDIHQPLHIGNGEDRGGNDIKVSYFRRDSNLHSVWDSGIIDRQSYSYTEYANWIDHPTNEQIAEWKNASVLDWVYESMQHRNQCYNTLPENSKLSYRYNHDNIDLVNQRLLQAGIRLGYLLNEIYG